MRHRLGISLPVYGYLGELYISEPVLIEERDAFDYKEYSSNVDAHLESGYKEKVLPHWKKMNTLIEEYNAMVQLLHDDTVKRIIRGIREDLPSFSEFSGTDEKPLKHFIPKELSRNLSYALQHCLDHGVIFDIDRFGRVEPEGDKWKLSVNTVFAESDNKKELELIQSDIKTFLNDADTIERVEKLRQRRKDAESELKSFKEKLTEIIKLVENGTPLEGRCEICKTFFKTP